MPITATHQQPTSTPRKAGPRRWKMWVLLTCAIYPLILVIVSLTDPFVHALPAPVRFLVVVPIMTSTVVWGVLPQIQRRFRDWLSR
jgi:antibiotic biosynthesis monooxygenase (ABM) superfamily enzyme